VICEWNTEQVVVSELVGLVFEHSPLWWCKAFMFV